MVLAERVGTVLAVRALRALAERIIKGPSFVLTRRTIKSNILVVVLLARRCFCIVVARFPGDQRLRINMALFHIFAHPFHRMRASAGGGKLA